jgi:hypothetical protein
VSGASHTPFSARTSEKLRALGLTSREIATIRAYQARLCAGGPGNQRLRATPRAQRVLLAWGLTAQDTLAIAEYLDDLADRLLAESDAPEAAQARRQQANARAQAAKRARATRLARDREAYNARRAIYMREYRARKRAQNNQNGPP